MNGDPNEVQIDGSDANRPYPYFDDSGRADARLSFASNVRPIGTLVHTSSGFDSLDYLLGGCIKEGRIASADFLIDHDGTQHRLCPPGRRPYHAGASIYEINGAIMSGDQISASLLGVELEQNGRDLCTWQQHDSLAQLVVDIGILNGWRWPYFNVGHYEVAVPIGRRSDPLGFNWGWFAGYLLTRARAEEVPGLYP
jgi:N-acetyl-anhydromuramyl-L-alanine amidase AmpD